MQSFANLHVWHVPGKLNSLPADMACSMLSKRPYRTRAVDLPTNYFLEGCARSLHMFYGLCTPEKLTLSAIGVKNLKGFGRILAWAR